MRFRAVVGIAAVTALFGIGIGVTTARMTTLDVFALSAHQLDVIRTMMSGAAALGGGLTAVNTVFSILARKWSKRAADQTATTRWVNGEQRRVPIVEYAKHAVLSSEAARQETADFYKEWVKGQGSHRFPTSDVPRISTYIGEEHE